MTTETFSSNMVQKISEMVQVPEMMKNDLKEVVTAAIEVALK